MIIDLLQQRHLCTFTCERKTSASLYRLPLTAPCRTCFVWTTTWDWLAIQVKWAPVAALSLCGASIEMKPKFVVHLCCSPPGCICERANRRGWTALALTGSKFSRPQHVSVWFGDLVLFSAVNPRLSDSTATSPFGRLMHASPHLHADSAPCTNNCVLEWLERIHWQKKNHDWQIHCLFFLLYILLSA